MLFLEKKILPPLLPGFELATFRSRVRRSNQQAPGYIKAKHPGVQSTNCGVWLTCTTVLTNTASPRDERAVVDHDIITARPLCWARLCA